MKCAPKAAASSITAIAGLIVGRHASSVSSSAVSAAIITPKPMTKRAPRVELVSGNASNARHSGQFGNAAIHRPASSARVSGFQPRTGRMSERPGELLRIVIARLSCSEGASAPAGAEALIT